MQTPTGPPATSSRKRRRGVVTPYDFRKPTTLAREHTRALEMAFETFARQWSTTLLTRLRQTSQVVLTGVYAQSYDEYVRSLPSQGVLFTFAPDPGAEQGLLQLESRTALVALDYLLGGRGAPEAVSEDRELTEIETRLLHDLAVRSLNDLAYAFVALAPMKPVVEDIESSPQFLQLAAAADVMIVATFTISVGEDAEAVPATMMLPLNPVLTRLQNGGDRARSEEQLRNRRQAAGTLARAVPELLVDVSARMSGLTMRPRDVLALSVGDVVRMPHPTTRPLDVVTNDVVLARAVAGTSGTRLACLVVAADEEKSR